MAQAVFCTVPSSLQAEEIINRLKLAGFSNRDISVLMPDDLNARSMGVSNETKAPEGATAGAGTGAVVGGVLGWLAGIGAIAIPGVGPLIAAGPIMAALSGAALGGTLGGAGGALVGMGIPEYEARRYEETVRGGHSLISVHTETDEQTAQARQIFEAAGGEDISTTHESSHIHHS